MKALIKNIRFDIQERYEITQLATVTLGMPSKDCRNFGICRIERFQPSGLFMPYAKPEPLTGNRGIAYILFKNKMELDFAFIAESLSEATIQKYFSRPVFWIMETVCFSLPTDDESLSYNIEIPVGKYAIEKNDWAYIVKCQILTQTIKRTAWPF